VQVGAYLAHDEGGPGIHEIPPLQRPAQPLHEPLEVLDVGQPAGYLFRAHLVGDGRKAKAPPLGFCVLHELHGAFHDHGDVERLAACQRTVHSGVYVKQRVTGLQARGYGALHLVHGLGQAELGLGVRVLEPGTAVVQARVEGRVALMLLRQFRHARHVLGRRPAGVAAVAVHLVQGSREQHRCPGPRRDLDSRLEDRVRVRAHGE
jgi:hypothetical protein